MSAVLMIVTSQAVLGSTGRATGYWLEELAAPYRVFTAAGLRIELASPAGGPAPVDPLSLTDPWLTHDGAWLRAEQGAMQRLATTRALADVDADTYAAAYFVGGLGAAWDFSNNRAASALVEALHQRGRVLAGVCHGVLGLADARNEDGRWLVEGRRVTGVSNAEERLLQVQNVVPVLPETLLRERGAAYSCSEPLAEHVVVDGRLMTGQNPASAAPLARAVVAAIGD